MKERKHYLKAGDPLFLGPRYKAWIEGLHGEGINSEYIGKTVYYVRDDDSSTHRKGYVYFHTDRDSAIRGKTLLTALLSEVDYPGHEIEMNDIIQTAYKVGDKYFDKAEDAIEAMAQKKVSNCLKDISGNPLVEKNETKELIDFILDNKDTLKELFYNIESEEKRII